MITDFRKEIAANKRKTAFLLFAMLLLAGVTIDALLLLNGVNSGFALPVAVMVSLALVWGSYYNADTLVLKMTNAKVIEHSDNPMLYNLVEELAVAANMKLPRIAIVEDTAPNAFATGRDEEHSVIAFTTGILNIMGREELQGVAGHELAHIKNRDTLVSAITATTAGALAMLSDIGIRMLWFSNGRKRDSRNQEGGAILLILSLVVLILAPISALLLQASISRKREILADAESVNITRNPTGLRKALEILAENDTVVQDKSYSVAHLYIESPLKSSGVDKLFDTHPPIEKRIELLRGME